MFDSKIARWATMLALVAAVGVTGCESEAGQAEIGEVPEVAEVETQPMEPEIELEEALPLTEEDVGDILLITGTVTGAVIPEGFFVATEHGRMLFVESTEMVTPGELVTVTGELQSATTLVFDEWEMEALEGEVEAEWDMLRTYYVEAGSVSTPAS